MLDPSQNPHLQIPKSPLEGPVDGKTVEHREILIDLDCLLDTRLGLISTQSQENAFKCLINPDYRTRTEDTFFDQYLVGTIWKDYWDKRHELLLDDGFPLVIASSAETLFPAIVHEYIRMEINDAEHKPGVLEEFKVSVNVFPYKLPQRELDELKIIIHQMFPHIKDVKVVSYETSQLTPAKIRREFDSYWLYDLPHWLNTHVEEFKTTVHPNTRIFAPRLMYKDRYKRELDPIALKVLENKTNFFDELEALTKLWFDLRFVDVFYYVLNPIPPKQEENKSQVNQEDSSAAHENESGVVDDDWVDG